jgi:hypothetical protein
MIRENMVWNGLKYYTELHTVANLKKLREDIKICKTVFLF